MKKTMLFTIVLFFSTSNLISQIQIVEENIYHYSLKDNQVDIDYIHIGEPSKIKPVMIFCQGSLPIPLVIDLGNDRKHISAVSNFNYQEIAKQYHLIVVSHPAIPIIAKKTDLNNQYAYVTDSNNPHSYPSDYVNFNYPSKLLERYNKVIQHLKTQKWVDSKKIIILGHSQGARIAALVAKQNTEVKALGFLSGNPAGRMTEYIWKIQQDRIKGKISNQEEIEQLDKVYRFVEYNSLNRDFDTKDGKDSPRCIYENTLSVIPILTEMKTPIFVAYGTEDPSAWYCDYLPIDFIREEKKTS